MKNTLWSVLGRFQSNWNILSFLRFCDLNQEDKRSTNCRQRDIKLMSLMSSLFLERLLFSIEDYTKAKNTYVMSKLLCIANLVCM